GKVLYAAGTALRQDAVLRSGMMLDPGSIVGSTLSVMRLTWPKGVPLAVASGKPTLDGALALKVGAVIPGATDVKLPGGAQFVNLRDVV
ncbi:hypothetical protein ABTK68_19340, partial [Acinetobacter baumannii]